jgi:hypothetical protein
MSRLAVLEVGRYDIIDDCCNLMHKGTAQGQFGECPGMQDKGVRASVFM